MEDSKREYYNKMTVRELKFLAEEGDHEAQFRLGSRYRRGEGVRKNYAKAVKWYTKAAEQGNFGALNNLGLCYARGKGVKKDPVKAVEYHPSQPPGSGADGDGDDLAVDAEPLAVGGANLLDEGVV